MRVGDAGWRCRWEMRVGVEGLELRAGVEGWS